MQFPNAIYSHEAALYLHNLAVKDPMPLSVTVLAKYNSPQLMKKGVIIIYVKSEWYEMDISEVTTPGGHIVKVYGKECTICDIVHRRSDMDIAVFTYAVKQYAKQSQKNLSKLMNYAKEMHIEHRVREIMEVLL